MMLRGVLFTVYAVESVLFFILTSVHGLELNVLSYPPRTSEFPFVNDVKEGDSVRLVCEYEYEHEYDIDTVTSVKWYKGNREFYRYDSYPERQFKIFPLDGINVDVSMSNITSVYLRNLSIESCGSYKVKIFSNLSEEHFLQTTRTQIRVEVPPSTGPYIEEDISDYNVGDAVELTCVSGKANPAPELQWYINDELIISGCFDQHTCVFSNNSLRHWFDECNLLKSSFGLLRFRITPHIIHDRRIILKCVDKFMNREAIKIIHVEELRSHIPLRIEKLFFYNPVIAGRNLQLTCKYYLGNETISSVKWYRDDEEFFGYFPDSETQFKYKNISGVHVDMSRSDESKVYLRNVTLESPGNYTCQVLAKAPYDTLSRMTRKLDVIVYPENGPYIFQWQFNYTVGDNVSFSCLSGEAKPAPNLKWYINDEMVSSNLTQHGMDPFSKLEVSELFLNFVLEPQFLKNGTVVLKCVSTFREMPRVIDIRKITPMA